MSEKVTVKVERNILHLPAIALRGLVVFPNNLLHFEVGRDKSIAAVEWAVRNKSEVFLIAQKDMKAEDPKAEEMYQYGVVAEIKQVMRVSDDLVRILVEGKFRAKRTELDTEGSFLLASVRPAPVRPIKAEEETEAEALLRNVKTSFDAVLSMNPRISKDVVFAVTSNNDPAFLCEYIPANLLFRFEDKQAVMEESTLIGRLRLLVERLHRERRMLEIDKEIAQKVDEAMDKNQRDYYLHEQMHMISQELGEDDDTTAEAEEYRRRIQELHLDEEREKKLLKEVDRLAKMQSSNQEGTVIRTYLDTCLDLPWNSFTEDDLDIAKAQRILDRDHYGLQKVKERILEFIAVRQLNPEAKGQILCLVGPPGVGKTSIVRSVAEAMNRKYARMSLGGVRDEADIRGHRKTYIGSMPGRIIEAVIKSGVMNPIILLDEIDKVGNDFKGDPSSALLEALDPEQNNSFTDHYIEFPVDLSKVLFITTANDTSSISEPLYDRMEVVELNSYTALEKFHIAKEHLIKKEMAKHSLNGREFKVSDDAINALIENYTREAGVRKLEKEIATLCRKATVALESGAKSFKVTNDNIEKYLGKRKFEKDLASDEDQVGVVNGLAWTSVGGTMLPIEVSALDGTGKIELTGNLGDVMKESAKTAVSYIRSKCDEYGIDPDFYKNKDIHIHAPEAAIPKDGPSAGLAITTAIVSELTGILIKSNIAMTGEISLKGKALPIGGLKEKSMAAYKAGCDTVIIPNENVKDLDEISAEVKNAVRFVSVKSFDELLPVALVTLPKRKKDVKNNNVVIADNKSKANIVTQ